MSVLAATERWISEVVIGHNFCPFAKREFESGRVHYVLAESAEPESCLSLLISLCERLEADSDTIETAFLILPEGYEDFGRYLDLLDLANDLLSMQGYEGVFQLASFHPDYCFEGEEPDDAANYTNRSPYPMLHLLREASLAKALEHTRAPELIPEQNIENARRLGSALLAAQLATCRQTTQ